MVCRAGEAGDGWVALLCRGHHLCCWLVVRGDGAEAVVVPDTGWKLVRDAEMSRQLSPAPTALRGCRVALWDWRGSFTIHTGLCCSSRCPGPHLVHQQVPNREADAKGPVHHRLRGPAGSHRLLPRVPPGLQTFRHEGHVPHSHHHSHLLHCVRAGWWCSGCAFRGKGGSLWPCGEWGAHPPSIPDPVTVPL